jgi:hypothetical protein
MVILEMMMEQNQVPPLPLYISDQCMDQSRLQGLSYKRKILSGFHQVALQFGSKQTPAAGT